MTGVVVALDEVRLTDVDRVGGKAASLGELAASGLRVPAGFVLTCDGTALSAEERSGAISDALRDFGTGPFAVRSSGVGEDGVARSYAGQYETVLRVRPPDVAAAVERCLASAGSARLAAYGGTDADRLAVIVQRMVEPAAAGVAFSADPVSGDRSTCVVAAARGDGERLVAGEAIGDEWIVRDGAAMPRRRPERAIDEHQATGIAAAARRIAEARGTPQDVEWAIDAHGELWILQARPMTGLPPQVSWQAPARGAYSRAFRFGEWISEPVTPLFESWLLTRMEDRLHEVHTGWVGQVAPRPHHVVVNGWYFYSLNFLPVPGASLGRSLPHILRSALRSPRRVAVMIPPTARHAVALYEGEWREDLQPRYRAATARAAEAVETIPVGDLPALIDELATLAGEYFASIAVVAGSAYKMEVNLAGFYRRHLEPRIGGSHLPLLAGLAAPSAEEEHAVETLDWSRPPVGAGRAVAPSIGHQALAAARRAAELDALAALAGSPRRLRAFRRLLAEAQHLVPVREEQVRELTRPWPIMRTAVLRIGAAIAERGVVACPDDIFFLTKDELVHALRGTPAPLADAVARRRIERDENARLVPPLVVGKMPRMLRFTFASTARTLGARASERAIVSGAPASPGRVTGPVRVIRNSGEFDRLRDGDVLVAPLTAPAWTPLFARAAAVVTDVGSALSHASIIAREYGIPSVVGCADATARLRDGMWVTVDGARGTVESASQPPPPPRVDRLAMRI